MPWVAEQLLAKMASAERELRFDDLLALTGLGDKSIENALYRLRRRRLVERDSRGCYRLSELGLVPAAARRSVRSGPSGNHTGKRIIAGTLRERAWRAMRIRRKFSIPELAELVATGEERDVASNLRKYITALLRAGYLRPLSLREVGTAPTSNGFMRYLLLRDLGPKAPLWRADRGVIFDLNTEESFTIRASSMEVGSR